MEQQLLRPTGGLPAKLSRKAIALRALIGFFAAMLALTVVARAADALTLPQVRTTAPTQGTLLHVVRAEGMIEPVTEAPVRAEAGLLVGEIHVVEGQAVKAGDPLLSYDRQALQEALDEAQIAMTRLDLQRQEEMLGSNGPDPADPSYEMGVRRAEENLLLARDDARRALQRAEEDLAAARRDLRAAQDDFAYVERTTEDERLSGAESSVNAAQNTYDSANDSYTAAVDAAQAALDAAIAGGDEGAIAAARDRLATAQADTAGRDAAGDALRDAQDELQRRLDTPLGQEAAVKAARAQIDAAKAAVLARERAVQDAHLAMQSAELAAQRGLEDAQLANRRAQQQRDQAAQDAGEAAARRDLRLQGMDLDIRLQQQKIDELEALLEGGATLTATQDGTVTEIAARVGEAMPAAPMRMALEEDGCYARVPITSDQAKLLAVGAEVFYMLSGESSYRRGGAVKSLRPVEEGFEAIVELPEGALGQSATLRIERSTDVFQQIVPMSALVKEGQRDGVYVIRTRQGILGEEEYAEFLSVEVLERDGTQAAISANLTRSDRILESSNKPVNALDRVRVMGL